MNLNDSLKNTEQRSSQAPSWYDGRVISETKFCAEFLEKHPLWSVNGSFFTVNGRVADEESLRKEIYEMIQPYIDTGLSKKVNSLMDCLRMTCYMPDFPLCRDRIHFANGTLYLDGMRFTEEKEFCRNRLPVRFNPSAPEPVTWLRFLGELLDERDILTLQEYMGYCLIPSTKAQKMLLIIGKGGEGKSRIGVVLQKLFGTNMTTSSITKIETNRFARADLENMLVMLDDDMQLEALTQTGYIKSIVTAELPMDLEKKGRQSYQGDIYSRFIGLGNGTLHALYDRSEGFFRRQIILTTKDKPPEREDDPYLGEKLCREIEGIVLFALVGLVRLIGNEYRFTMSERSIGNLRDAISEGNNLIDFMKSEGYFRFKADGEITSKEFYNLYRAWCEDNITTPHSARSFSNYLRANELKYNLKGTNNIYLPNGKRVRGFLGVQRAEC